MKKLISTTALVVLVAACGGKPPEERYEDAGTEFVQALAIADPEQRLAAFDKAIKKAEKARKDDDSIDKDDDTGAEFAGDELTFEMMEDIRDATEEHGKCFANVTKACLIDIYPDMEDLYLPFEAAAAGSGYPICKEDGIEALKAETENIKLNTSAYSQRWRQAAVNASNCEDETLPAEALKIAYDVLPDFNTRNNLIISSYQTPYLNKAKPFIVEKMAELSRMSDESESKRATLALTLASYYSEQGEPEKAFEHYSYVSEELGMRPNFSSRSELAGAFYAAGHPIEGFLVMQEEAFSMEESDEAKLSKGAVSRVQAQMNSLRETFGDIESELDVALQSDVFDEKSLKLALPAGGDAEDFKALLLPMLDAYYTRAANGTRTYDQGVANLALLYERLGEPAKADQALALKGKVTPSFGGGDAKYAVQIGAAKARIMLNRGNIDQAMAALDETSTSGTEYTYATRRIVLDAIVNKPVEDGIAIANKYNQMRYYVDGLLAKGRKDDALTVINSLPNDSYMRGKLRTMYQAGLEEGDIELVDSLAAEFNSNSETLILRDRFRVRVNADQLSEAEKLLNAARAEINNDKDLDEDDKTYRKSQLAELALQHGLFDLAVGLGVPSIQFPYYIALNNSDSPEYLSKVLSWALVSLPPERMEDISYEAMTALNRM